MALNDVKEYYLVMLNQYITAKADLVDFEQALQAGYITEDKLESVQADITQIKSNLDRIQYIMYLFSLPQRSKKKKRFLAGDSALIDYFKNLGVDINGITDENTNVLTHLRAELKKLKEEK